MIWIAFAGIAWFLGWSLNVWLARRRPSRWVSLAAPLVFGVTLVAVWEGVVRGMQISQVLLPAPSVIAARLVMSPDVLWGDFVQTVIKGALSGYIIGCGAAFAIAIAIDR
ncbi:MAG: ABC transporter permease, partial [Sulfitobacter sp.]